MKKFLASVALTALLALPAAAQDEPTADTVLATVGDEEITLGHLIAVVESLPPQFQQLPNDQLYEGLLEQMVRQVALAQSLGDTLPKGLELTLEGQRWALLANSVISEAIDAAVTEEAVQAAYDAQFGAFEPEREFNASHILVETEEEALALVAELGEGVDFSELAQARSIGPSGPNGGALGWFGLGMMVPEFEAAVIALEPETVSGPVETQFGWHVIRLNDVRDTAPPSLEDVRGEIENTLAEATAQEIVNSLVGAASITRTDVEIDPALIRDTGLLD
jgi:peptidyl-prolyl cis-trans isomerase C